MLCKCGRNTKGDKPLCYYCYLTEKSGASFALATKARLHLNNVKRHERNRWRKKKFSCEMGYGECERRGFCNGDC